MNKFYKSENGILLPTVLIIMIVAFGFAAITLTYSTSQVKTEIKYEHSTKALQAAEAGLHTYLWTLNKENATIKLNETITYPETNPEYGYILEVIDDSVMKKKVRSTGWSLGDPEIKQTMTAEIKKKSFTAHVYFTNNESTTIKWATGDKCYGPMRTNKSLAIDGLPTFYGKVFYKDEIKIDGKDLWEVNQVTLNTIFKQGTQKEPAMQFPPDNNELATIAKKDGGKYHFQGRTSILMKDNGDLYIWNAYKNTRETLKIPDDGVIYVANVGNTFNGMFDTKYGNVFISGKLKGRLTVGAENSIYITDYNPTIENFQNVGAETNGVMYADTTFSNDLVNMTATGTDMLGLIPNQDVAILTRGWFNNNTVISAAKDIYVHAAILTLQGAFCNTNTTYPTSINYDNQIYLRGSLAQNNRGAVGLIGNTSTYKGYSKNYVHDPRLNYHTPPYFLEPKNSGWEITEWN